MTKDVMTHHERAYRAAAAETRAYWDDHGDELHERYGGQFVALQNRRVVAHAPDSEALSSELDRLKVDRNQLLIRFVPPADAEFALANDA